MSRKIRLTAEMEVGEENIGELLNLLDSHASDWEITPLED